MRLVVLFAALLPRLWIALSWKHDPVWDGYYYDIGAKSIAAGAGYVGLSGGAWCHYPVGYSGLLGFVYAIFGSGVTVGPTLNALLGAGVALMIYELALIYTSPRRALVAGLLVAFYPGLIVYTPLLMTEPTATFTLTAAALVAAKWGADRRGLIACGVLLGLATLVRPQSILCAPFVGLLIARPQWWRAGAVATLVAVLTVSPWTLRNCVVMDGCAFVSTNAGWNLAIGSFPRATGRFETLRSGDGCHIITGQVQQDRCWLSRGIGWIKRDPERWLGMVDKKWGFTFDHESFPIGYLSQADPPSWPEARRVQGRGALSWSYRVILLLAALGVAARPSRKRPATLLLPLALAVLAFYGAMTPTHPFWPIALAIPITALWRWHTLSGVVRFAAVAIATLVITHAVFFGEDRYHMVMSPFFCLLACKVGERQRRKHADDRERGEEPERLLVAG